MENWVKKLNAAGTIECGIKLSGGVYIENSPFRSKKGYGLQKYLGKIRFFGSLVSYSTEYVTQTYM